VQRARTIYELFKKGVFRKDSRSSAYIVFVCFEQVSYEDTPESPLPRTAVKKGSEASIKKEKKKKAPILKESKPQVKKEVLSTKGKERKRALSQISSPQEKRSPRTEPPEPSVLEDYWESEESRTPIIDPSSPLSPPTTYALRSKQGRSRG
jgi:hypothetical protein